MTFREEAALRLLSTFPDDHTRCVQDAQDFADLCCNVWGHQPAQDPRYYPTSCARCGLKYPKPTP